VKGAFIWNAEGTLNAPHVPRMFAKGINDGLNRGTTFLGIGTDGSVRRWFNGAWEEHALFKGWTLKMLAIDNPGNYWCVSTQSNVGKWDGSNWIDQPKMDHWTLRMLAFDLEGNIWCVGTENNIGKWDPNQEAWIDQKALNQNATIDSIAFGPDGTLYALGTFMSTKAVRAWNGDPNSGKGGWSGTRLAGGWTLKAFFLDADSQAWAVGISGNVGKLVGDNYVDQPEFSGFTLNWLMSPI